MSGEPPALPDDTKDWTWVIAQGCPECGWTPPPPTEIAARVRATVPRWQAVLRRPDVAARTRPERWSALEYACHVRDVCRVFGGRLTQLLTETRWRDVDYLVIDMPPGTGDIQLTLAQRVPVTGALIVTTPQDIALIDARKAVAMFQKVGVPLLGLVENMAVYCCPNCGHEEHIFGADGGKAMAAKQGLAYLGALPLQRAIREQSDAGTPPVVAEPDGQAAQLYLQLARQAAVAVSRLAKDYAAKFPTISVSKST